MENQQNDLVVLQRYGALTVTTDDPRITAIAKRLHVGVEAAVKQIATCLPSPIEQRVYIAFASHGVGLRPDKFAEVLRAYKGDVELTLSALDRIEVSKNIFFSEIEDLENFIEILQGLRGEAEMSDFKLSTRSAIALALTYGENAEKVLDSIAAEISNIAWVWKHKHLGEKVSQEISCAVSFFACQVIPVCARLGLPAPLSVMSFFEEDMYERARAICAKRRGRHVASR